MAENNETETAPPAMDVETGVAMDGEFPHNHRLRAEALAKAGKATDPGGLISDELIADAKARLARLEEAEKSVAAEEAKAAKAASKNPPASPAETATGDAGDSKGA